MTSHAACDWCGNLGIAYSDDGDWLCDDCLEQHDIEQEESHPEDGATKDAEATA